MSHYFVVTSHNAMLSIIERHTRNREELGGCTTPSKRENKENYVTHSKHR